MSQWAGAFEFDRSLPTAVADQIRQDLQFVSSIQGSPSSQYHQEIFGAMDGVGYKNFFENRVTLIGFNNCGGGNAVACVIPWLGDSKMWVTQNYIKFNHPQISRLMVLFHEARHTEEQNGNWPHARCPVPFEDASGNPMKSIWTGAPLAGEPACDHTPFGSYGSSLIMLKNISRHCTSCTDKVKMDAGIYADDQFGRITDETARTNIKKDIF